MLNVNDAFVMAEGGYGAGGANEVVALRGEPHIEGVIAQERARPHTIGEGRAVSADSRGPGCRWSF